MGWAPISTRRAPGYGQSVACSTRARRRGNGAESRRLLGRVGRIAESAATKLRVRPGTVGSLICTTVPGLGDGVELRRNGPILAICGDNLMKFAPVLGEVLAEAAVSGGTPTIESVVQDRT